MTPRSLTVSLYYPGDCISVNHYRGLRRNGYYVRPEAKAWKEALGWLIKSAHIEDWRRPLTVECSGRFKDLRSCPDLSNLSKCALDSIEDCTGVNDREMRWRDGDIDIDATREPELTITITEAEYVE